MEAPTLNSEYPRPLPLNAFEHYMYADGYPKNPVTYYLRFIFQGHFDREKFNRAFYKALDFQPIYRSFVNGSPGLKTSQLFWVPSIQIKPELIWSNETWPSSLLKESPWDLTNESGLKVYIRENAKNTELIFKVHHASGDGIGNLHFFQNIIEIYANFSSPDKVKLTYEGSSKKEWNNRNIYKRSFLNRFKYSYEYFFRFILFFIHRVHPIGTSKISISSQTKIEKDPFLMSFTFSRKHTAELKNICRKNNVTLNCLLLRDLFLALKDWTEKFYAPPAKIQLRIAIATNLRPLISDYYSPGNIVSMLFFDRNTYQIKSPNQLLSWLRKETKNAKKRNLGLILILALKFIGKFKNGMFRVLNLRSSFTTTGFTNLGEVFTNSPLKNKEGLLEAGKIKLIHCEVKPPLRKGTDITFSALSYGNCLTLSGNFNPKTLSSSQAIELRDLWISRIKCNFTKVEGVEPCH